MKKLIFSFLLVPAIGAVCHAQCDQKVLLTSSKTEHLGSDSTVQRTEDELTTIEYDKTSIVVTPGEHTMNGKVVSQTCDWKVPFKEGKTVLKTIFTREDGQEMNITINIEGKNGKINFLAEIPGGEDKLIRLNVDKFEAKK